MKHSGFFLLTAAAAAAAGAVHYTPSTFAALDLPAHPRLILTDDRVSELVNLTAFDVEAGALYSKVQKHGLLLISNPENGDGGLWDAAYTLGFLHRMQCAEAGYTTAACPLATQWSTACITQLLRVLASEDYCGGCANHNCTQMSSFSSRAAGLCFANLGEALAIGLDWLWYALTQPQRDAIAAGITNQILDVYAEGLSAAFVGSYWFNALDNFNAAISAGAVTAALAVLDYDAAGAGLPLNQTAVFAADTLALALVSLRHGLADFKPDGGGYVHAEGTNYMAFGLNHLITVTDAVQTALGPAFADQLPLPSLQLGHYGMDVIGPTGALYNWADGPDCTGIASGCFLPTWGFSFFLMTAARRSQDGAVAVVARRWAAALDANGSWGSTNHWDIAGTRMLLDWTATGSQADLDAAPKGRAYPHARVASLRTGWSDPRASWVAFKGADNHLQQQLKGTTHTHADAGSFVADAGGAHFAVDLGNDAYTLPGYFGMGKFRWYKCSTAGHNTLLFGGRGQDACVLPPVDAPGACTAPVSAFALTNASAGDGWGTVELSGVYGGSGVQAAARGIALRSAAGLGAQPPLAADVLLTRDEFALLPPPLPLLQAAATNVTWSLHTFANVSVLSALSARLTAALPDGDGGGGERLVSLGVFAADTCPGAAFVAEAVTLAPPQLPLPGLSVLRLEAPDAAACTAAGGGLTVLMSTAEAGTMPLAALFASVLPLSAWPAQGPWAA